MIRHDNYQAYAWIHLLIIYLQQKKHKNKYAISNREKERTKTSKKDRKKERKKRKESIERKKRKKQKKRKKRK